MVSASRTSLDDLEALWAGDCCFEMDRTHAITLVSSNNASHRSALGKKNPGLDDRDQCKQQRNGRHRRHEIVVLARFDGIAAARSHPDDRYLRQRCDKNQRDSRCDAVLANRAADLVGRAHEDQRTEAQSHRNRRRYEMSNHIRHRTSDSIRSPPLWLWHTFSS
jgi:hypothetical protein